METKINEIVNYFKDKLLSGSFEVEKIDRFEATVVIDSKYRFSIWIANWNLPSTRCLTPDSFMNFALNDGERFILHGTIAPHVRSHRLNEDIKAAEAELEELKRQAAL